MDSAFKESILRQISDILYKERFVDGDRSNLPLWSSVTTGALAIATRVAGMNSPYISHLKDFSDKHLKDDPQAVALTALGVLRSLKHDIENGYLESLSERIRGELFGDLLEMAFYLQLNGFEDDAVVIAGSALEGHLRQLCRKHGVDVNYKSNGYLIPKKANILNSELARVAAYEKLDQKNVIVWLGMRNGAAHGYYDKYSAGQVGLLIDGVRNFITRVPA